MKMRAKSCLLLSLILGLALLVTNGWWAYRSFTDCAVFPYHEEVSADGQRAIMLLYKSCGATAPFTTQAVLQSPDQPFRPRDYVPFLVTHGLHELQIRWLGDARIEIQLPRGEKVYRHDEKVRGVTIVYR